MQGDKPNTPLGNKSSIPTDRLLFAPPDKLLIHCIRQKSDVQRDNLQNSTVDLPTEIKYYQKTDHPPLEPLLRTSLTAEDTDRYMLHKLLADEYESLFHYTRQCIVVGNSILRFMHLQPTRCPHSDLGYIINVFHHDETLDEHHGCKKFHICVQCLAHRNAHNL